MYNYALNYLFYVFTRNIYKFTSIFFIKTTFAAQMLVLIKKL